MEVIDINLDNLEPVELNFEGDKGITSTNDATPSVNFGPGVELLMNDKKITKSYRFCRITKI